MICLVVLNYKDSERVARLVDTCLGYSFFEHIIVVNNPSTDEELRLLKDKLSKDRSVHLLEANENGGYAKGHNVGLRYARTLNPTPKYAVIVNSDVEISKDTMIATKRLMDKYERCAIASARIIDKEKPNIEGCWAEPTFKNACFTLLHWKKALRKLESKTTYDELGPGIIKCFAVRGSYQFMRFKAVSDVNFFDEDTFLYCEESNLAAKLKRKGYYEIYDKNEHYLHNHIYKKGSTKKMWLNYVKSKYAYFVKYGDNFNICKRLILHICIGISYLMHIPVWIIRK